MKLRSDDPLSLFYLDLTVCDKNGREQTQVTRGDNLVISLVEQSLSINCT